MKVLIFITVIILAALTTFAQISGLPPEMCDELQRALLNLLHESGY